MSMKVHTTALMTVRKPPRPSKMLAHTPATDTRRASESVIYTCRDIATLLNLKAFINTSARGCKHRIACVRTEAKRGSPLACGERSGEISHLLQVLLNRR
jgi:hypothetical protein